MSEKKSISYYVVNKGLIPGIYTSWSECKKQVDGFTNPIYKKFDNEKDALAFHNLELNSNQFIQTKTKIKKETNEKEIDEKETQIKEEKSNFKNITYIFCDGSAIHKNYKSIKCSFGLYIINPFENDNDNKNDNENENDNENDNDSHLQ